MGPYVPIPPAATGKDKTMTSNSVNQRSRETSQAGETRNSPARCLDHFVISVRDLNLAAQAYERLGFQVLPVMRHLEIGTCNRVFQLEGTYVELIADLERAPPPLRDRMMPRFLCGEGLAIVSLTAEDLLVEHARLSAAGMEPAPIINARRRITMPDGSTEETDSHCFYVWRDDRTFGSLFLSKHYKPSTIWVAEYQRHPNGAIRVLDLVYASNDLAADVDYFARMVGSPATAGERGWVMFRTPRNERIFLLASEQLETRFGAAAPEWSGALPIYGVGLRYQVRDLDQCRQLLRAGGVTFLDDADTLSVPAAEAAGVVTEFVAAIAGVENSTNDCSPR